MTNSIYLKQSYEDAWDDYRRSLVNPSFPVWDYVVLTASNEHIVGNKNDSITSITAVIYCIVLIYDD